MVNDIARVGAEDEAWILRRARIDADALADFSEGVGSDLSRQPHRRGIA